MTLRVAVWKTRPGRPECSYRQQQDDPTNLGKCRSRSRSVVRLSDAGSASAVR